MNIIFLGMPVPVDSIDEQDPRCHFAKIGALAQVNLLRGIKRDKGNKLSIITASYYGKTHMLDLGNGMKARAVSNLRSKSFGVFLASLIPANSVALLSELKKIKKQEKREKITIITLNTALPFSVPILLARLFYKNLVWCPFLVDSIETPHYDGLMFRIANKFGVWAARRADASITYNAPNATDYIPNKPYLELFFGVNEKDAELYKSYVPPKGKKFTIAYVGAFTDIYNFDAIAQVIERTGKKYRWIFAGYGPNEDTIKKLSRDKQYDVTYLGVIGHDDAIKLHKAADLLLCLRLSGGTKANSYSAKYAASGKLSEYLCSGTPILSTDIEAISQQLKPFLNFTKDSSSKEVQVAIEGIVDDYKEKLMLSKQGQSVAFRVCDEQYQSKEVNNFLHSLVKTNQKERGIISNKMNWMLIAIYVLLTVGGLVLLKLGTGGNPIVSFAGNGITWNIGIVSLLGLFCYGVSFLLYMFLISKFDLGYIVPLATGLVYILVFVASFLVFKESISIIKIIAATLIIAGVILLNIESKGA